MLVRWPFSRARCLISCPGKASAAVNPAGRADRPAAPFGPPLRCAGVLSERSQRVERDPVRAAAPYPYWSSAAPFALGATPTMGRRFGSPGLSASGLSPCGWRIWASERPMVQAVSGRQKARRGTRRRLPRACERRGGGNPLQAGRNVGGLQRFLRVHFGRRLAHSSLSKSYAWFVLTFFKNHELFPGTIEIESGCSSLKVNRQGGRDGDRKFDLEARIRVDGQRPPARDRVEGRQERACRKAFLLARSRTSVGSRSRGWPGVWRQPKQPGLKRAAMPVSPRGRSGTAP